MFPNFKIKKINREYVFVLLFILSLALLYNINFFKDLILWGQDTPKISFPFAYLLDESLKNKVFAFWTPDIFFGFPVGSEQGQLGLFYFPNIIHALIKITTSLGILYVIHFTLLGFFTFLFAREKKLSILAALASGVAFQFNGFIIAHAQYPSHVYAIIFLPLVFYLLEKSKKGDGIPQFLLIGALFAIQFFTGHPNIPLITIFASILYLLISFRNNWKKLLKSLLIITITSIIISFPLLYEWKTLIPISTRAGGVDFTDATNSSMNPYDLITFIFPNFFFKNLLNTSWIYADTWHLYGYWGQIETFGYVGVVTLFLSIFSLSEKTLKKILPFLTIAFLAFLIALGRNTPLYENLIFKIPLINGLRAPGRFVVLIDFCLAILSGYGLDNLMTIKRKKLKPFLTIFIPLSLIILTGLSIRLVNFPHSILNTLFSYYPTLDPNIPQYLKYSLLNHTSTSLILLSLTSVILLIIQLNKRVNRITPLLLILLLTLDLILSALKINIWQKPINIMSSGDPVIQNLSEKINYTCCRIYAFRDFWSNLMANRLVPHHIADGNGFVSMELKRNHLWQTLAENNWHLGDSKLFQLGSIKYVYELKSDEAVLTEISNTLPRAYISYNFVFTNSSTNSLDIVSSPNFNQYSQVVIENKPTFKNIEGKKIQPVNISNYRPDYVMLNVKTDDDGLLVLTDTNYPGWKVYVNGKEEKIIQTNYLFRGVQIRKGESIVEFKYNKTNTLVFLILSYILTVGIIVFYLKTNHAKKGK